MGTDFIGFSPFIETEGDIDPDLHVNLFIIPSSLCCSENVNMVLSVKRVAVPRPSRKFLLIPADTDQWGPTIARPEGA